LETNSPVGFKTFGRPEANAESAFRILAESVAIDNFPKENNEVASGSKKRLGAKRKDNFATQNNEHRGSTTPLK
jgi:hypothetical protein